MACTFLPEGLKDVASHLGRPIAWVEEQIQKAKAFAPESANMAGVCSVSPILLGLLDREDMTGAIEWLNIEEGSLSDLPRSCHLFKSTTPILGQGARGTCVAMSLAKTLGFHSTEELSPEWTYYVCKCLIDENEGPGDRKSVG